MSRSSPFLVGRDCRQLVLAELIFQELDVKASDQLSRESLVYKPMKDLRGQQSYPTFTAIINEDGSPWIDGSLYLYERAYIEGDKHGTISKKAQGLADFKRVVQDNNINYLESPRQKFKRPTYFYLAHLNYNIDEQIYSENYAERLMNNVHDFYKWLVKNNRISPEYPLWHTTIVTEMEQDEKGFYHPVERIISDLRIKKSTDRTPFDDFVMDGGKLRPMSPDEKLIYREAATNICSPEYILASEFSLDTGAREQTVFTLREKDLKNLREFDDERGEKRFVIPVGKGTGVDTKNNKKYNLFVSAKVLETVETYVTSKRRLERVKLAQIKDNGEQYIFLTKFGNPFYISDSDRRKWKVKNPPDGSSARWMISYKLIPEIRRLGGEFSFHFHDLRATFAMDTYRQLQTLVNEGKISLYRAKSLLAQLLGHSNTDTVEAYIHHGEKKNLLIDAQRKFENDLKSKL